MTSLPLHWNTIRTGKLKFPETGGKFGKNARGSKAHKGWDLIAPVGTAVYAVGPGEITQMLTGISGYGTLVQQKFLRGSKYYWALYAHLSMVWVKKGDRIKENQMIANSGRTGNTKDLSRNN